MTLPTSTGATASRFPPRNFKSKRRFAEHQLAMLASLKKGGDLMVPHHMNVVPQIDDGMS